MAERTLLESALDCEDASSGLYRFRDALPRYATRITAILSDLFALSAALRKIHHAENTRTYGPSFYRINDDLALVRRSIGLTTQDIFDMFSTCRPLLEQSAWEDLELRFARHEGSALQQRLEHYRLFLDAQNDVLEGHEAEVSDLASIRRDVTRVLAAQQRLRAQASASGCRPHTIFAPPRPHGADLFAASSSPPPRRRRSSRALRPQTPSGPSPISDDCHWERPTDAHAPDPPLPALPPSPLYASFSSASSQATSSHTSHSSDSRPPATPVHWAEDVFDGSYPTTRYRPENQSVERSECCGELALDALEAIASTGFQRAMQMSFDEDLLWVQLYYRPADSRAIILIMTHDAHGQPLYYSERLAKLKLIREASLLMLCRVCHASETHSMWARLNFLLHERMVLFYNTFVAMKHQDPGAIAHRVLLDHFQLERCLAGEHLLFAGEIRHAEMRHVLRLFRDAASHVVRLEASPLRGPRKDVPIWTAFVTKYAYDPDWAEYQGTHGVVALAKLVPSVFVSGYVPPVDARGNAILPFASDLDARMFMGSWASLCRRYGR